MALKGFQASNILLENAREMTDLQSARSSVDGMNPFKKSTPFNMAIWKHPPSNMERTDSIDIDPLFRRQSFTPRRKASIIPFEPLTTRQSLGGQRSVLYYILYNLVVNIASCCMAIYKYATYMAAAPVPTINIEKQIEDAEKGQCTNIARRITANPPETQMEFRTATPPGSRSTTPMMFLSPLSSSSRYSRGRLNSDSFQSKAVRSSLRRSSSLLSPTDTIMEQDLDDDDEIKDAELEMCDIQIVAAPKNAGLVSLVEEDDNVVA